VGEEALTSELPTGVGRGKVRPSTFRPEPPQERQVKIASVSTQGYAVVNYVWLAKFPPFDGVEQRVELVKRLNVIPGVHIPERPAVEALWPGIDPKGLAPEAAQRQFLEVFEWVVARLEAPYT
jgi:hypothetical protein